MARTNVNTTKLATNTDILAPAGVAVDQPNGMQVTLNKHSKTIIVVTNTSAATKTVTVRKSPNSFDNPATDITGQTLPATTGMGIMGPYSGRYAQGDGLIFLDFQAGHTGVVYALELPTTGGAV